MIYIGIPVREERHTIGPLLWRIRELLYGGRREFHVLVCDDASGDGTRETLERYPRVLPMTLLRSDERRGYAASLERIVREAARRSGYPKRDALVTLQGDFTDAPERIPEMVRRFDGGADLVTLGAEEGEAEPRGRRWARAGARWLAGPLAGPPDIGDPFGTLRLYRLFVLVRALEERDEAGRPLLGGEGWAANAELLLQALPHARRVERVERGDPEVEGPRRYRESRFRPLSQVWEMARAGRDPAVRAASARAREAATP